MNTKDVITNSYLTSLGNSLLGKAKFLGVFPCDTLMKRLDPQKLVSSNKCFFIVNLASSQQRHGHYVGISKIGQTVLYFDPLSLKIKDQYVDQFLKSTFQMHGVAITYLKQPAVQHYTSNFLWFNVSTLFIPLGQRDSPTSIFNLFCCKTCSKC